MNLRELNQLSSGERRRFFAQTCSADSWIAQMAEETQWQSLEQLSERAESSFENLSHGDWLQAFEGHPQIGDVDSLREKYASTKGLAGSEQHGVSVASEAVLTELAALNRAYLQKFGFIFIVFATGKSAEEMLTLLKARLPNSLEQEMVNGAEQQIKITQLRLRNALSA